MGPTHHGIPLKEEAITNYERQRQRLEDKIKHMRAAAETRAETVSRNVEEVEAQLAAEENKLRDVDAERADLMRLAQVRGSVPRPFVRMVTSDFEVPYSDFHAEGIRFIHVYLVVPIISVCLCAPVSEGCAGGAANAAPSHGDRDGPDLASP